MKFCTTILALISLASCGSNFKELKGEGRGPHRIQEGLRSICEVDGNFCTHWFDMQDLSRVYQEASCSTQVYTQGEAIHCVGNKGSMGPERIYHVINNVPSLETAGINGFMAMSVQGSSNQVVDLQYFRPNKNSTLFVVFNVIGLSVGDPRFIIGNAQTGATNASGIRFHTNGNLDVMFGGNLLQITANHLGVPTMITASLGEDVFDVYENGMHQGSNIIGDLSTPNHMAIGALYDSTYIAGPDFYLGEFVYFDTKLTDHQRKLVEEALRRKWGL